MGGLSSKRGIGTKPPPGSLKLLVLGAGNSGKTTIFKQFIERFGRLEDKVDLSFEKGIIIRSYIRIFTQLLVSVKSEYGSFAENERLNNDLLNKFFSIHENNLQLPKTFTSVSEEQLTLIKEFFQTEGCIEFLEHHKRKYWISESIDYFADNAERICAKDYIPTEMDYLKRDDSSSGFKQAVFRSKEQIFFIVDTGGQGPERFKWPLTYESVAVIVFVASLADFDRNLFEDSRKNCLKDAIELCKKTLNCSSLINISFILLLTKSDLLEQKLDKMEKRSENLDDYFPQLKLGMNYDNAFEKIKKHIEMSLLAEVELTERYLFVKYLNATDSKESEKVLEEVLDICVKLN